MKCDHCDNEATVREVTMKNGARIERHLCEQCAQQHGIGVQPQVSIDELIGKYVLPHVLGQAAPQTPKGNSCPTCRMGYAEFKQGGLLGCPDCYKTFENQLAPLIERAHEGATHHIGKGPRRRGGGPSPQASLTAQLQERAARLRAIRKQLDEAVKAEQYEKAARLRDELRKLDEANPA
ncbi:MAG: UvrB/UvrC motif-containing protein [Phycisphaerales bacterium]|nr:UvrB/UvrC motif-containing protein [Phycisphaerales bacterium]